MGRAIQNLDRPGQLRDDLDHFTQWLLDEHGSDLISLWPLGEQPGAGDFVDVAGPHDASIEGGWSLGGTPITWDGPDTANADGSTGYGDVGDEPDFDYADGDAFTWLWWGRFVDQSFKAAFSKVDDASSVGYEIYINSDGTNVDVTARFRDGTDSETIGLGGEAPPIGGIHCYALTIDSGQTATSYLDGAQAKTGDWSSLGDCSTSTAAQIGRRAGGDWYWPTDLSMVAVLDTALTHDKIARIYQRGVI